MNRLLARLLLIFALFGLAGQGVAQAAPICPEMATASKMSANQMDATKASPASDCMKAMEMAGHKQAPASAPCKHMTLACLAMAGCAPIFAARLDASLAAIPNHEGALTAPPPVTVLTGRAVPPDLRPPVILG